MKIFPRILLNTLPLIILGMTIVGGLNYYIAQDALGNLAEKWLMTKLDDGIRIATDNVLTLRKYGLEDVYANVDKAQQHTGDALLDINIGKSGFLWVVDGKGTVVVHKDPERLNTSMLTSELFATIQQYNLGVSKDEYEGKRMFVVYAYFPSWNWYVLASAPYTELYGEADKMRSYMFICGFIALVFTAIVLMILARRLTAPINILAREADRISRGDNRKLFEMHRGDEIGTLSMAFSRMTQQLNYRIDEEQLISDVSGKFININPEEDVAITQSVLKQLGQYTGAAVCYILAFSKDGKRFESVQQWSPENTDAISKIDDSFLHLLPEYISQLEEHGYVELQPDENTHRLFNLTHSIIWFGLMYGNELRGIIGIESYPNRPWDSDTVSFMMRITSLFSNSLERQWYQNTLANEKGRLDVTLQSIGDGVITTDVTGKVVLINRIGEILTGWKLEEALSLDIGVILSVVDERTREMLPIVLSEKDDGSSTESFLSRCILIAKNGEERLIASSSAPILEKDGKNLGYVLVIRDITEKKRMEEELVKMEKLESIGVLAGGIAHDFNNILTAIIGNLSLAKYMCQDDNNILKKLDDIEKASYRAQDLTQQLLTFSKGGEPIKKRISLADIVRESALFSLGGSNCKLDFSPKSSIWNIEADEGQLSQVINNLIINAIQAMPDGGIIEAHIDNITHSKDTHFAKYPGRYVQLTLKDNGEGMSKEVVNKIFDPFFTTKEGGSGLGLATVYSIIEKHGGFITVDSILGKGSVFTIYLPAVDDVIENHEPSETKIVEVSGTILLMDDEKDVRDVVGKMLNSIGYQVDYAEDGAQMLEMYRKSMDNDQRYSVVLVDLTIPGAMGGKEAVGHLLQMDPDAVAVVSSGYNNDPVMADYQQYGFKASLAKPYGINELSDLFEKGLQN